MTKIRERIMINTERIKTKGMLCYRVQKLKRKGYSNKAIAKALNLPESSVRMMALC